MKTPRMCHCLGVSDFTEFTKRLKMACNSTSYRAVMGCKKKKRKKKPNAAKQDDFVMQTRRVCMVSVVFTVFTLGSVVENEKEVIKNGVVL